MQWCPLRNLQASEMVLSLKSLFFLIIFAGICAHVSGEDTTPAGNEKTHPLAMSMLSKARNATLQMYSDLQTEDMETGGSSQADGKSSEANTMLLCDLNILLIAIVVCANKYYF